MTQAYLTDLSASWNEMNTVHAYNCGIIHINALAAQQLTITIKAIICALRQPEAIFNSNTE